MRNLLLTCSIPVLLFAACKKDPPPPPSYTITLSPVLRDYGYFRPGTYWIYEDSASHVLDSVYVTSASIGNTVITKQQNLGYTGTFGYFKEQYQSTYRPETGNIYVDMQTSKQSPGAALWHDKTVGGVYVGQNILMTDIFNYGYTVVAPHEPNGALTFMGGIDTLKVLGKSYFRVVEEYNKQNILENNNRTNVYLARYIGVIRKELLDSNKVWNLKRYNIVQ